MVLYKIMITTMLFSLCGYPQAEEMEDEKQIQNLTNAGKDPLDC